MWTRKFLSLVNITILTNQVTNLEQSNQCETHRLQYSHAFSIGKCIQSPTQCSTEYMPSWWHMRWKISLGSALERINQLIMSRDKGREDGIGWKCFANDVVVDINMFRIFDKTQNTLVVGEQMGRRGAEFTELERRRRCEIISLVVEEVARYSAWVVLLAQLACLRQTQRTRPWLTKKSNPNRERRSSRSITIIKLPQVCHQFSQ